MERGLLSDPDLAASFGDVVWMYLFQDFSGSVADRAAQRVAIRFGITAWPQHFLVDPFTLQVVGDTGRGLASFRAAVAAVELDRDATSVRPDDLAAAEARAAALEREDVAEEELERALGDDDPVVRFRAIERLQERAPERIVEAAPELLAAPHDQTRFLVCRVLAEHGGPAAREVLESLLVRPEPSRNPNVLRCRAAAALARCGDARSLAVLAPFAQSGDANNALTALAVGAVAALGARSAAARREAVPILAAAFPRAPDPADPAQARRDTALARRIHAALTELVGDEPVAFPATYDAEARAGLVDAWGR